jgi:hypothetical protein
MVSAANNTNNMNLTYSTYHGGNKADQGTAVAVDNQGNTYITGYTNSSNFNTSDAYQNTYGGGIYDAFLSKFDSNGTLIYSTYLGGDSSDFGYAIAVDNNRNVYITGQTMSTNFPTTSDAYQQNYISGSGANVFLSKFNSTETKLSTYLGDKQ